MATLKTKRTKTQRSSRSKIVKKTRRVSAKVLTTASKRKLVGTPTTGQSKKTLLWIMLLLVGLQLICGTVWYCLYQKTILSFQTNPSITYEGTVRTAIPTNITIPSANISLPITPAAIKNGIWEISSTTATHLADSSRPGEGNNIVVYGHNLKKIFGNLSKVKNGDSITIAAANNKSYEYKVARILIVKPEEIESVLPTEYEVLTVYTCTGWLDSKRLVIQAYPVRVSSY